MGGTVADASSILVDEREERARVRRCCARAGSAFYQIIVRIEDYVIKEIEVKTSVKTSALSSLS